ncbi:hypothetical protein HanRHA438_Chr01g0036131 [Helianthus annuus]|nr:hypothetical protein HanRHA438_Chr01g0036131 [Helianthus annuus]
MRIRSSDGCKLFIFKKKWRILKQRLKVSLNQSTTQWDYALFSQSIMVEKM